MAVIKIVTNKGLVSVIANRFIYPMDGKPRYQSNNYLGANL